MNARRTLTAAIKAEARALGFDLAGVAPAVTPGGIHAFLDWLDRGCAGEMDYLPRRRSAYEHPRHVLDGARSVVMLAMNYNGHAPPGSTEEARRDSSQGASSTFARVARYASGSVDYHDLLRPRLDRLASVVKELCPGSLARGVVDTAPLLERDFARMAGLGWFGKNTMLIHKNLGSWFFLAALVTDAELEYDPPHGTSHCGTCTRCLDACPTGAFVEPYVLDARKCISYLTIEHRGPISEELREGIGDWLFGCDICQEVCPWNRKTPQTGEPAFRRQTDRFPIELIELFSLSPEEFRARFRGMPLERPRRAGLLRNAAIILGNRGDPRAIPALIRALWDSEPVVRGAAAWALSRFSERTARQALQQRREIEDDPAVRNELDGAEHPPPPR